MQHLPCLSPVPPVVRTSTRYGEEVIQNRCDAHNQKYSRRTASYLQMKECTCHHETSHQAGTALGCPLEAAELLWPSTTSRAHFPETSGSDLWPGRAFHLSGSCFRRDRALLTVLVFHPVLLPKTSVSSSFFLGNPLKRQEHKGGAFSPFFWIWSTGDKSPSMIYIFKKNISSKTLLK